MREEEKNHLYAKLLSIISDEDRLKYEKILADLLTKKDQLQADQCVNCEREAEEFDDDDSAKTVLLRLVLIDKKPITTETKVFK